MVNIFLSLMTTTNAIYSGKLVADYYIPTISEFLKSQYQNLTINENLIMGFGFNNNFVLRIKD